jgi:hypothetical protein
LLFPFIVESGSKSISTKKSSGAMHIYILQKSIQYLRKIIMRIELLPSAAVQFGAENWVNLAIADGPAVSGVEFHLQEQ